MFSVLSNTAHHLSAWNIKATDVITLNIRTFISHMSHSWTFTAKPDEKQEKRSNNCCSWINLQEEEEEEEALHSVI